MPNGSTRAHLKKVNNKMLAAVKGSKKNKRLKAVVLDILSEGDAMITSEIHDIMRTKYHCPNLGSTIALACMLATMPQVEKLGNVRGRPLNYASTKSCMLWSLRSIE